MRASARFRDKSSHRPLFPSRTGLADQRLAVGPQLHYRRIGNPQRFACQAGSLIEKLPQTAANQRLLAERGYDRLLQRIVLAPIADVFEFVIDHCRITCVR